MGYRPLLSGPDVLIKGAGVIGLSLALELRSRGFAVSVQDRGAPMSQASAAAAGMLAAEDPHNPLDLRPLSRLSAALYPKFLAKIAELSGLPVPLQTDLTLQTMPDATVRELAEHSIDPRQLAPALIAAAESAGVQIFAHVEGPPPPLNAPKGSGSFDPRIVVYATGAWPCRDVPISPRKGQMLRVRMPQGVPLQQVLRAEHIYVVPRIHGPQAGTALIGATVEDAGFDTSTSPASLAALRRRAADLVPALADETRAPMVEAWAGLRPATPDGLPVLGELEPPASAHGTRPREFIATGHFRNGILLAPATAILMADLIEGRPPQVSLQPFSPARFACPAVEN